MDYQNILSYCTYLREKAIAEDPNFDADNYHWELGYAIVEELLKGLGLDAERLDVMNELYGICVKRMVAIDLMQIKLFKEVK